jgi:dihydroorotase
MKMQIKNGRVIDPANGVDADTDIWVSEGKIAAVGELPPGFVADHIVDARGCIVCPGLVDLAARLREPGGEYKATLESEMAAAVAAGVTTLACPPDTDPPLDEPGLVKMLKQRARHPDFAHVYPVGALTVGLRGERLTEMAELAQAGCVAFSQANIAIRDTRVLMLALQYAATFDFPVWLAAQDPYLSAGGVAHDGAVAARLGLPGIPVIAETIALASLLQLARETGARLHVTRLSSAAALDMIVQARKTGLRVSCDVAVHHLHLTEDDIGFFDTHARLAPPLRARKDCEALREGLASGAIDALCSNHSPVDDDAKQVPFAEAQPGATALELLLPLTLQWAAQMDIPWSVALSRITTDPARIMGIAAGTLDRGASADLCIFDPHARQRLSAQQLRSQGHNTCFLNHELPGRVRYTLIGGHIAYTASTA